MGETSLPDTANKIGQWQQGSLIDLTIDHICDRGDGVGRWQGQVVFVPDTAPGDRISARLLKIKKDYAEARLEKIQEPSPFRVRPRCIVADKCGGCQWQHVAYAQQLAAKQDHVEQVLRRLGGLSSAPVAEILAAPQPLGYRNKSTYPLGRGSNGQVRAGYYQKNSHSLINLNQCPIQNEALDPLLAEIKQDIQTRGWSVYNEAKHQGRLRHLSLRIGENTGEILLTLVTKEMPLAGLADQARIWLERYPALVGVCANINPDRTNVIFGHQTICVAGRDYLEEKFAGLTYHLRATTFFQVNTGAAAVLWQVIQDKLDPKGVILDAYCGIGTFSLPLAQRADQVIGFEIQPEAIAQAKSNAHLNHIGNATFYAGRVEELLPNLEMTVDTIILDPPRQGCDRRVLETILQRPKAKLIYISCKPATLSRDLRILVQGGYRLELVQPVDFFPQTAHVEAVAFLH